VAEVVATGVHVTAANVRYLRAKIEHTHHTIAVPRAG
jgi:GTP cyclohydrolase II